MSSDLPKNIVSAVVLISLATITGGLVLWIRHRRRLIYESVGKVAKLVIYPVKSLPGIEVDHALVTKTGLQYGPFRDRSLVLVTTEDRFITQRSEPSLALVRPSFHDNELWIDGPDMPTLKVKVRDERLNDSDIVIDTKIWGNDIQGVHCGPEAEEWFSIYLNKSGIKLIESVAGLELRQSKIEKNSKLVLTDKYKLIYQDGAGLHLLSQSSIDDLNTRLPEESRVTYKNFRPNILVTDCQPYEEDCWRHIAINDTLMTYLKPCDRCVMTTVNTDTGVISHSEPLNTMRKYRLAPKHVKKAYGTAPLFGISIAPVKEGVIRCGDTVLASS